MIKANDRSTPTSAANRGVVHRQDVLNGAVHNWYRLVLGYSDHLVSHLLEEFRIGEGQQVIDPFCGAGTTIVECMKRGIDAVGIDANPSSYFAARVKTNWRLRSDRLLEVLEETKELRNQYMLSTDNYSQDPTYAYLERSGMLERGWISRKPLRKAIALKNSIRDIRTSQAYKDALTLALLAEVLSSSNVKFGPELYCGPKKRDARVFAGFTARVKRMAEDLDALSYLRAGKATIIQGDSRFCDELLPTRSQRRFAAVICSPPYPAEHDYTRNARLELAFLEEVIDLESLRSIKKGMIRSHTKGFYKGDNDAIYVQDHPMIQKIVATLQRKIKTKNHGFALLYPTIVQEYFGGMKRHLSSIRRFLEPRARCAYVLGDQYSYVGVHIPTARVLSSIAEEIGYTTLDITHWRTRWATTTSREVDENILILSAPK